MSENELKDTQPTPVDGGTQPSATTHDPQPRPGNRFPRWLVALIFILLIVIGVLGGYGSGMAQRYSAQKTQDTGLVQDQMTLGLQALDAGQYEIAKKHLDYVIQHDPTFPGIQDALTKLLLKMNITPSPTITLTPTVSPTPDLRGADQIFNHAVELLNASDWSGTISALDSVRQADPTFKTAEVDGMYYTALRMRGVEKIAAKACADANLEGGIYDLTLAERFGPLDSLADGLRTYARLYIIGASFWDQDWVQAQSFFSQVMNGFPNMSDASCETATKRWQEATIKYAEQLLAAGDYCGAEAQYESALTVGSSLSDTIAPTAVAVSDKCNGNTGGGDGGGKKKPTATPTTGVEVPTETPTETVTPTEIPTDTTIPSGI